LSRPNSEDLATITKLLSADRLAAFVRIAGSESDAVLLHQQSIQLAGALMPVTGTVEVALRNAISDRLRSHFGSPDWLASPPPPFKWKGAEHNSIQKAVGQAKKAAYAKRSYAEKRTLDTLAFPQGVPPNTSHERRSKQRQRVLPIGVGDLVSQLTLFFWKRLLSGDYEATLWKPALRELFPDKQVKRSDVATALEAIYVARNRVAHHESVFGDRLTKTLEAITFLSRHLRPEANCRAAILETLLEPHLRTLDEQQVAMDALLGRFTL